MEYPDEIEWRRREEVDIWREREGWTFRRYEDWVVASSSSRMVGEWNSADAIVDRISREKIGPDTDDYGDGVLMEQEEGIRLINRLKSDGTLGSVKAEENGEWNFNETVDMVGIGGKGDGVLMA